MTSTFSDLADADLRLRRQARQIAELTVTVEALELAVKLMAAIVERLSEADDGLGVRG